MVELAERIEIHENQGQEHRKQQLAKDSWLDNNGPTLMLTSVCLISPVLFLERHRIPEFIRNLVDNIPIVK